MFYWESTVSEPSFYSLDEDEILLLSSTEDDSAEPSDEDIEEDPLDSMTFHQYVVIMESLRQRILASPDNLAELEGRKVCFRLSTEETIFGMTTHPEVDIAPGRAPEVHARIDVDGVFGEVTLQNLSRAFTGHDIQLVRNGTCQKQFRSKACIVHNGNLLKVKSLDSLEIAQIPIGGKFMRLYITWPLRLNSDEKIAASQIVPSTISNFTCQCGDCLVDFELCTGHIPLDDPKRTDMKLDLTQTVWSCFASTLVERVRVAGLDNGAVVLFSLCDTKSSMSLAGFDSRAIDQVLHKYLRPDACRRIEADVASETLFSDGVQKTSVFWTKSMIRSILPNPQRAHNRDVRVRSIYPQLMAGELANGQANYRLLSDGDIRGTNAFI